MLDLFEHVKCFFTPLLFLAGFLFGLGVLLQLILLLHLFQLLMYLGNSLANIQIGSNDKCIHFWDFVVNKVDYLLGIFLCFLIFVVARGVVISD